VLLKDKTAIVYGAAGAIGSAVARAYAREGATVHLTGRTEATLEQVAERVRRDGGTAQVAQLDVLDRSAVEHHASAVTADRGIDICFNANSNDDVQGTPLIDLAFDEFMRPVTKSVTAHFNIATAVAPHMIQRGTGVILAMAGGREAIPNLGGAHVAWAALAGLCRCRPRATRRPRLLGALTRLPRLGRHGNRAAGRRQRRHIARPATQLRRRRQHRRLRRLPLGEHDDRH
jgi:3-oxoacyl-[acyl-carrier protein] reductase